MAKVDGSSVVTEECLQELLDFFIKSAYKARNVDRRYEVIHKCCIHLVGRDYKIDVIDNKLGQFCAHYPSELIVIEKELKEGEEETRDKRECVNNVSKLRELIPTARFARCRSRFVMPVILFENKNICRSSTLSTMAELYGRSGFDWILTLPTIGNDIDDRGQSSVDPPTSNGQTNSSESDWILLNKIRGQDVQLLKALGVTLICDLMVEKKKLKYGLYVCSSEKVDKWARYADFNIASMPYPGCEFFKDYRDNGYNAVSLKFDWNQTFVDAELNVPANLEEAVGISCKNYQEWDLIEMTQNYMKMLLQYIVESEGGILVHCISGWDRTPLYISLLRLTLWADGKIHKSLCAAEILYFTLAYDWLIYGHQLKERHDKGEEVLYFCFDFLKYMMTEDFSVVGRQPKSAKLAKRLKRPHPKATPSCTNTTPIVVSGNGERLERLQQFEVYPTRVHGELGESWVGGSRHTSSSSSSSNFCAASTHFTDSTSSSGSTPEHSFSATGSISHHSLRAEKLNNVRELFLKAFRTSIPEAPENPSSGTLAGLTGFLSKLASTVINSANS